MLRRSKIPRNLSLSESRRIEGTNSCLRELHRNLRRSLRRARELNLTSAEYRGLVEVLQLAASQIVSTIRYRKQILTSAVSKPTRVGLSVVGICDECVYVDRKRRRNNPCSALELDPEQEDELLKLLESAQQTIHQLWRRRTALQRLLMDSVNIVIGALMKEWDHFQEMTSRHRLWNPIEVREKLNVCVGCKKPMGEKDQGEQSRAYPT